MLVSAKHYLDFELNEPQIDAMVDVASEEEAIEEIDRNDPVMMKMRAAKMQSNQPKKPDFGKEYGDAVKIAYGNDKNAKKLAFLKKEREQLMRDMEQEAEPEGGPIADEYGSKLNRIDAAIAKLSGRKEMTYDQAIAENDSYVRVSEPKFIKDKKYSKALQSETPMEYLQAIKDAGYATDQSYVQTVGDVYQQYKNAGIFN